MAIQAKYGPPLQVVETIEKRARILAIADAEGISQAQVIRDIIDDGLSTRERRSAEILAGRAGNSVQP
jgi:hypothetical protein